MDRALLVGINKYPGAPLRGCVNDVNTVSKFLVDSCGFNEESIHKVTDGRATTERILDRLQRLVRDAKPGDRLVFHYSGHGAQLATRRPGGDEVDNLDEVICPVDFDWTDQHAIRDKQFREIFSKVPQGVHFVWISDSCHSGDLTRVMPGPGQAARFMPPPDDLAWRVHIATKKGLGLAKLSRAAAELNLAYISGCKDSETSCDAVIEGKPSGALTYHLIRRLRAAGGLTAPLKTIVEDVQRAVADYHQTPQLEGSKAFFDKPFLPVEAPARPVTVTIHPPVAAPLRTATPVAPVITVADLAAGDVLLYRGTGWLSRAIQLLDGTPVSHAGLYLGDEVVGEAIEAGVVRQRLQLSVAGREWVLARRLPGNVNMQPVIERATYYLGQNEPYAWGQLVLLAFLCLSRRIRPTPIVGALIRRVLDMAAEQINRTVSALMASGKEPMICSEFVYRCFDEADPAERDAYSLAVDSLDGRRRQIGTSRRGTAIEAGSILDVLGQTTLDAPRVMLRDISVDKRPLEELFAEYELELARGGDGLAAEDVALSVQDEVARLAMALQRVDDALPAEKALTRSIEPRDPVNALFAMVKDFVTPGDLLQTLSLIDVGFVPDVIETRANRFRTAWQRAGLQPPQAWH